MRDLLELARLRDPAFDDRLGIRGAHMQWGGAFRVPVRTARKPLLVIASNGAGPGCMGWDHASVSLPGRCPTWDEMELVKRLFFAPDETAMQLHVPESEHISNHPYCLHIWRPLDQLIPKPPAFMVGVRDLGEVREVSFT